MERELRSKGGLIKSFRAYWTCREEIKKWLWKTAMIFSGKNFWLTLYCV